jgi:hypothetical protein
MSKAVPWEVDGKKKVMGKERRCKEKIKENRHFLWPRFDVQTPPVLQSRWIKDACFISSCMYFILYDVAKRPVLMVAESGGVGELL